MLMLLSYRVREQGYTVLQGAAAAAAGVSESATTAAIAASVAMPRVIVTLPCYAGNWSECALAAHLLSAWQYAVDALLLGAGWLVGSLCLQCFAERSPVCICLHQQLPSIYVLQT